MRAGGEELRERRRTDRVELRKKEREDQAMKRRQVGQGPGAARACRRLNWPQPFSRTPFLAQTSSLRHRRSCRVRACRELAPILRRTGLFEGLASPNPDILVLSTSRLRRLLSQSEHVDAIIDSIIELGVLEVLVQFLDKHELPTLQFEAAWCLTNIASGARRNPDALR